MPIKPKPWIFKCPSCQWQKLIAPQSDVLMPGEYFDSCPECGCDSLKQESATVLQHLWAGLTGKN